MGCPLIIDIMGYRQWAVRVARRWELSKEIHAHLHPRWDDRCQEGVADMTVLVGWSAIIPEHEIPARCYVVHPSMLPAYRGGSPIQHQIIDGLDHGGVSILELHRDQELDAGPLVYQEPISLEGDLEDVLLRIERRAAGGIADIANHWYRTGEWPAARPQAPGGFTRRRRTPEESDITHVVRLGSARSIHDHIRALQDPYPNAFMVTADGERVYLTGSHL